MIPLRATDPNSLQAAATFVITVAIAFSTLLIVGPIFISRKSATSASLAFLEKIGAFTLWTLALLAIRVLSQDTDFQTSSVLVGQAYAPRYLVYLTALTMAATVFSGVSSTRFGLLLHKQEQTLHARLTLRIGYALAIGSALLYLLFPATMIEEIIVQEARDSSINLSRLALPTLLPPFVFWVYSCVLVFRSKLATRWLYHLGDMLVFAGLALGSIIPSIINDTTPLQFLSLLSLSGAGAFLLFFLNEDVVNPARSVNTQLELSAARSETLRNIGLALNSQIGSEDLFNTIVQETLTAFNARRAFLNIFDVEKQQILANYFAGEVLRPYQDAMLWKNVGVGVPGWVLTQKKIAILRNHVEDLRDPLTVRQWRRDNNIGPLMIAPIFGAGAQVVGLLGVINDTSQDDFTPEQVTQLQSISESAAIAIRNSQLLNQQQQARLQAEILFEVSQATNQQADLEGLLHTILSTYYDRTPCRWVMMHLMDRDKEKVLNSIYLGAEGLDMTYTYPQLMDGLLGYAFLKEEPVLSLPGEQDERESDYYQKRRGDMAFGSVMCAPMTHQDHTLGVITVINNPDTANHTQDDLELLTAVANQMANTIVSFNAVDRVRQREQQLKTLIDNAPEAIVILDIDTDRFLEVNPVASALFGYSVEELKQITSQALVHGGMDERRLKNRKESLRQVFAKGHNVWETTLQRANGDPFRAEIREIRLPDTERRLIRASILDITDRKQKEAAMLQSQKLESLGVMAGGIAHDFNNLLLAIMGQSQIVQRRLGVDHKALKNVKKIEQAALRASELTRQMMAYAGRGQSTEREPVNVNQVISENVELLQVTVPDNVRLTLDLMETPPSILAERGQIQQVIMNMMINASEAIGADEGSLHIRTRTYDMCDLDLENWKPITPDLSAGRYMCLEFKDDGCGMDEETQLRIFDPFFTTKNSGHGLGLAAVLGILRSHKGSIQMRSVEGEGTEFDIIFPIEENVQQKAEQATSIDPNVLDGRVILVVDDETAVLETVTESLRSYNIQVYSATSGIDGLALYADHQHEIDLTLLDVSMPGISGVETMQRIHREHPEAKVILSSGYNRLDADKLADVEDNVAFLQKPYRAEQLMALICNTLPPR